MIHQRLLLCFTFFCFISLKAFAAEPVFEVKSPEEIGFNYPDPPMEGAADFFPIAENGEPRCVIVVADDAASSLRAAVAEFAKYLELATGVKIKIQGESAKVDDGVAEIHVGQTKLARSVSLDLPDLNYGGEKFPNRRGFLVQTMDTNHLVIRGADEDSTKSGLVGFLKKYVGVRQYWYGAPDALGSVIPDQLTLKIPQIEWRDWPYIVSYQMSLRSFGKRPYLDFHRKKAALPASENYNVWLKPSEYAEDHPEYYALVNGERLKPTDEMKNAGWQPCVSNPEVQRVMAGNVIKFFRENPDLPGINVAINDGGGDCTCEKCRAMDAPETDYSRGIGMSDRYVKFTNRICEIVGEEFADKFIVYLAYANASAAPQTVTPHPRLLPVTTTSSTFERWDEWMQSGVKHLGAYAHHLGTFALLPKTDPYQQAKRIRYMVGSGAMRTYYMECHTQWPHADIIPYLTAELLWDPRTDVDALFDEYITSFYGKAADPIRDYYSTLRNGYERWLDEVGRPHWYGKDMSSYAYNKTLEQFRVLSPEEADDAAEALGRAINAAKGDELVSTRIGIIHASFALQKIAIDRSWAAYRLRDEKPQTENEARERIADARIVHQKKTEALAHIENVLEKPPFDQFMLYRNSTKPQRDYVELKTGVLGPELRSIVSLGLFNTETFLRNKLGSEKAAAWWKNEAEKESFPSLKAAFTVAAENALSPAPENLVTDAGFEEFAAGLKSDSPETFLSLKQLREAGVHLTFPDRTPYRGAITRREVHSGEHALMLEHCARLRFTRYISAEPNTRYRAGFWFRQDEGTTGPYKLSVDVRLKDGSYKTLSTMTIPDEPNRWRQFVADVVTPEDVTTLFVRLHGQNQAAGTRCWIDDVFIYR